MVEGDEGVDFVSFSSTPFSVDVTTWYPVVRTRCVSSGVSVSEESRLDDVGVYRLSNRGGEGFDYRVSLVPGTQVSS